MEALRGGEAPKTVMLRTMRRYYRKAEKFENALEGDLIAWLTANRDCVSVEEIIREVVRRSKTVDELYDKAVKIAAQLAPYYHPTLAAIHHTGEVEVQNIVRVPDTAESVEQWLKGTPGELRPSLEAPTAGINSAKNL
jgi:hypothetical protein